MVEQRTENPRVVGSIPTLATIPPFLLVLVLVLVLDTGTGDLFPARINQELKKSGRTQEYEVSTNNFLIS